jgi:CubicO group peptidase (beta-lactamase class C family)
MLIYRNRLLITFLLLTAAAGAQSRPPDIDAWVARSMKTFDVPGVALAIVKDGRVVLAKGYGVRKLGETAPVDADTLFGIASNSKAFTAATIAMLVDEGKLDWDDPVIKYLPAFRLDDPFVSSQLTVRDLLCHRTGLGLGAGDLLFWPDTDLSRDQVVAAARGLRPTSSLRSKYAYNNLAFVVAGQLVPAITGKSWDEFVRERIFAPLDMSSSTITSAGFKPGVNFAVPHSRGWRLEGELKPIAWTPDDTWAAAAGIKSSANDLVKWVIAQLGDGKLTGGQQLFSKRTHDEMWSPQTIVRIRDWPAALASTRPNFATYGLGWGLRDYRGHKVVSHGGALTGMVSTVFLVPDEKLGIVVLTNQEETGAYSAIVYHVLDYYLRLSPTDWVAAFRAARDESLAKDNETERRLVANRATGTKPSLNLERYAGEYKDDWYGKVIIEQQNDHLVLRMTHSPNMTADLEHWQYDTFKAVFRETTIPDALVDFDLKYDGTIGEMRMTPLSDLADFSFDYQDLRLKPVVHKTVNEKSGN